MNGVYFVDGCVDFDVVQEAVEDRIDLLNVFGDDPVEVLPELRVVEFACEELGEGFNGDQGVLDPVDQFDKEKGCRGDRGFLTRPFLRSRRGLSLFGLPQKREEGVLFIFDLEVEVTLGQVVPFGEDCTSDDDMFKFLEIPRPPIAPQDPEGFLGDSHLLDLQFLGVFGQDVLGDGRDLVVPLAEGWDREGEGAQPIIEVF